MKFTEKEYNEIKMLDKLSSIGEIVSHNKNHGWTAKNVKLAIQCDSYEKYVGSYDFQRKVPQEYTLTNYTLNDVIRTIVDGQKQILKAIGELQNESKN